MNTTKGKTLFNIIALLFMLVILPGGSIIYLAKGFQHQKDTYAELKDYGQVPNFQLLSHQNQPFNEKDLEGKVVAAGFTTLAALKSSEQLRQNIVNLNSQFGDRQEFLLLTYLTDTDSLTEQDAVFLREQMKLKHPKKWLVLRSPSPQMMALTKGYQLPEAESPSYALVDTSSTIRHYYRATEKEEVGELAKHIAMILPRVADKDAILKREKEK